MEVIANPVRISETQGNESPTQLPLSWAPQMPVATPVPLSTRGSMSLRDISLAAVGAGGRGCGLLPVSVVERKSFQSAVGEESWTWAIWWQPSAIQVGDQISDTTACELPWCLAPWTSFRTSKIGLLVRICLPQHVFSGQC